MLKKFLQKLRHKLGWKSPVCEADDNPLHTEYARIYAQFMRQSREATSFREAFYFRVMAECALPWRLRTREFLDGQPEPERADMWVDCIHATQLAMAVIAAELFVHEIEPKDYCDMAERFTEDMRANLIDRMRKFADFHRDTPGPDDMIH